MKQLKCQRFLGSRQVNVMPWQVAAQAGSQHPVACALSVASVCSIDCRRCTWQLLELKGEHTDCCGINVSKCSADYAARCLLWSDSVLPSDGGDCGWQCFTHIYLTVPGAAKQCLLPATGMDVARKVTILARECGLQVELAEVPVQSLVPKELRGSSTADEFMGALPQVRTGSGTAEASCRLILRWGRGSGSAHGVHASIFRQPQHLHTCKPELCGGS